MPLTLKADEAARRTAAGRSAAGAVSTIRRIPITITTITTITITATGAAIRIITTIIITVRGYITIPGVGGVVIR